MFVTIAAESSMAQPLNLIYPPLQARVGRAVGVVVTTVDTVSEEALQPELKSPPGGNHKYTLTLKIREILKGEPKEVFDGLSPKMSWGADGRYGGWSIAGTRLLCFLGPVAEAGGQRDWDFIRLDPPESAQEITRLDLAGPDLTDNAMKQVADLRNLRTLCLDRASATDAGAAELQKALPDCKIRLRD